MFLHMKRTTLLIDSALYGELKRRAAASGRTLTETVEQALRRGLARAGGRHAGITLPSFDLGPFLMDPADRRTFGEAIERPGGPGP